MYIFTYIYTVVYIYKYMFTHIHTSGFDAAGKPRSRTNEGNVAELSPEVIAKG